MNEGQALTRYIKHLAESANFKGGTFNKICNGLIGNRFEMPNVSYTHPLLVIVRAAQTGVYDRFIELYSGRFSVGRTNLRRTFPRLTVWILGETKRSADSFSGLDSFVFHFDRDF